MAGEYEPSSTRERLAQQDQKVGMFNPRPPEFQPCPPGHCETKANLDARAASLTAQRAAQDRLLQEQRINAAANVGHPYRPYGVMEGVGVAAGAGAAGVQKDKVVRTAFSREEVLTVLKARKATVPETSGEVQHQLSVLVSIFERME